MILQWFSPGPDKESGFHYGMNFLSYTVYYQLRAQFLIDDFT